MLLFSITSETGQLNVTYSHVVSSDISVSIHLLISVIIRDKSHLLETVRLRENDIANLVRLLQIHSWIQCCMLHWTITLKFLILVTVDHKFTYMHLLLVRSPTSYLHAQLSALGCTWHIS